MVSRKYDTYATAPGVTDGIQRSVTLRSILKIRWDHYVTNDEVLDRATATDIEIILIRNRLRWTGHVARMPDEQPADERHSSTASWQRALEELVALS